MKHKYLFLNDLNKIQRSVCESSENFILTACPGSGKTRTITYRLAYLSSIYMESKLLNIAITYTNRAADEIENRLLEMDIDTQSVWTGTIHQFCMRFIIRPYSMYHKKLCKGYAIIDEFLKEKYVKEIADNLGVTGYINDLYNNQTVMTRYYNFIEQKREIDFDQILEYSLELVIQNSFVAQNISKIIRSIHVDEYQDTNEKQYNILSTMIKANKKINILFVGDVNQAIYGNLGGVAKTADEIRVMFPVEFVECCLEGCYRSTQRIVDYYVNYEVESTGVSSVSDIKDVQGIVMYNSTINKDMLASRIAEIVIEELKNEVPKEEICIVAPQWYQIFPLSKKLRELLPDCEFDAPDITPIKYDPLSIYFLIAKLLFTQNSGHTYLRRKLADEIIVIISADFGYSIPEKSGKLEVLKAINSTAFIVKDGIQTLRDAILNVFNILKIKMDNELEKIYTNFFNKIEERISRHKLEFSCDDLIKSFKEKKGIVISTIHGVKGEEYTTVIGFDLLNGHLPHWNYIYDAKMKILRNDETNKMLYVLCSRAKVNLHLFSEKGRSTNRGYPYTATDELAKCAFEYDLK